MDNKLLTNKPKIIPIVLISSALTSLNYYIL